MRRLTNNGRPGMVAAYFANRDEVNGRTERRPTDDEIHEIVAAEVARILGELEEASR